MEQIKVIRGYGRKEGLTIEELNEGDTICYLGGKYPEFWQVSSSCAQLGVRMLHNSEGHVTWITQEQLDKFFAVPENQEERK